jgi:hypothetical protein
MRGWRGGLLSLCADVGKGGMLHASLAVVDVCTRDLRVCSRGLWWRLPFCRASIILEKYSKVWGVPPEADDDNDDDDPCAPVDPHAFDTLVAAANAGRPSLHCNTAPTLSTASTAVDSTTINAAAAAAVPTTTTATATATATTTTTKITTGVTSKRSGTRAGTDTLPTVPAGHGRPGTATGTSTRVTAHTIPQPRCRPSVGGDVTDRAGKCKLLSLHSLPTSTTSSRRLTAMDSDRGSAASARNTTAVGAAPARPAANGACVSALCSCVSVVTVCLFVCLLVCLLACLFARSPWLVAACCCLRFVVNARYL